ncbi:MAG: hypothetical protein WCV59_01265 [Parcubacteria group bacterium]|jgi:hypothetical protein
MKKKISFLAAVVVSLLFSVVDTGNVFAAWSADTLTTFGLPSGTITSIVGYILLWLLYMLGIVGVIGFVISGLMYLISTGDQTMIDRAKKGMTYSIVGIVVGLVGLVIIRAVDTILRGASSTF